MTVLFLFLYMCLHLKPSFPSSHGLLCFLMGPFQEVYCSSLHSFFLAPYTSSGWPPFVTVTSVAKLELFYRAASRAIIGCLSFSPTLFRPPLRFILTHFALPFFERALRFPPFLMSGLTRLRVKSRLSRFS